MRAVVLLFCLGGCLSAPPDATGDGAGGESDGGAATDGGAGSDGGATSACAPGSRLDLAFVNQVAISSAVSSVFVLVGMAVVINPGPDSIVLPTMHALPPEVPTGFIAEFTLEGPDDGIELAPDEAKGVLASTAQGLVGEAFSEAWVDEALPTLAGSFALPDDWEAGSIPLELEIGGYRFHVTIEVVENEYTPAMAPLSAERVSAYCEEE